jgi:hypothetical protein
MVAQDVETHQDQPEAAVKSLEPPRPLNDRGKIEEGELNIVKSRFDKQKASAIIKTNKGSCAHHFKSYDSGKIVCGAAPPGYTGEFANFKGCGKTLTDAEF